MSWLRPPPRPLVSRAVRRRVRRCLGTADGAELRRALASLAPVCVAFGRYLSARPDLFSVPSCRELAALDEGPGELPSGEVERLLAAGLGARPEVVFERFDAAPCACDLAIQAHRARLRRGADVEVRLARPDLAPRLAPARARLASMVARARGAAAPALARSAQDFFAHLELRRDFVAQARAFAALDGGRRGGRAAGASPRLGGVRMASIERATPELLVFRRPPGRPLGELLGRAPAGRAAGAPAAVARTAARRLCQAWLGAAFLGGWVLELAPLAQVTVSDGGLVLAPGPATALTGTAARRLWAYSTGAAGEGEERELRGLLAEMAAPAAAGAERSWLRSVQRAVPPREGGWEDGGDESLAESLFLHWRLATTLGYTASPALLAFYRGLFAVAAAARRLAPGSDALREAVDELRLAAAVERLAVFFHPGSWLQPWFGQITAPASAAASTEPVTALRGAAA